MSEFRLTAGECLDWKEVISNFQFLRAYGWHDSSVIRRIFSLARHLGYRSVLIDDVSGCDLCAIEGEAIHACNLSYRRSRVTKCSFFKSSASGSTPKQEDFIGYVVVKEDYADKDVAICLHVYESVLRHPFRDDNKHFIHNNHFVHCGRNHKIMTSKGVFYIRGVLFAQQNGISSLCAHVAIRSALDCMFGDHFSSYGDYNAKGGIQCADLQKTISSDQIERILESYGCKFRRHDESAPLNPLTPDFDNALYGAVESGLPALLVFRVAQSEGHPHMIPILGHSFGSHTWAHVAEQCYFGEQHIYSHTTPVKTGWVTILSTMGTSGRILQFHEDLENGRIETVFSMR